VATCESKQGIKAGKDLILGVGLIKSKLIRIRVENTSWSLTNESLTQAETYFYRRRTKYPYVSLTVGSGTLIN